MFSKRVKRSRHNDRLTIPEYFSGKTIFITGATGFMGKVLLEKLLRSCPQIEKIYLLMRPKKGKDLQERLEAMISLPLFVRLKRENKNYAAKLVPINGDVTSVNLGLSEDDAKKLSNDVSVVFHVAANVRFNDTLRSAIIMNTKGTYNVVTFAAKIKNLEVLMHVSTTYCNTDKKVIEEKVYPAPANWREMIKLAESCDDHTLDVFNEKLVGNLPNTYTFTKALAEHVVMDHRASVPSVIFRPSIVISTLYEPMPGWLDNFHGPVSLLIATGKGIIRSIHSDPLTRSDYIPVDVAVKAMITAAWDRATSLNFASDEVPVYNCCAADVKSITQAELVDIGREVTAEVPLNDILWLPGGSITKCKYYHYLRVIFLHFLPALLVDFILKLNNKPPLLVNLQRKIFVANEALTYFITNQWTFKNDKLLKLDSDLLEEDRPDFEYYYKDIDVYEYFKNCIFGGREYLLKEDNSNLPEAKKHYQKMYWIDKITKSAFLLLLTYISVKLHVVQYLSALIRAFHSYIMM